MSHMVIYRGSDGKPGYHQTDDIHDAVGFVEQMRNDQGVEHARIFRLEEVVFQYKPYFRVELAESGAGMASASIDRSGMTNGDADNTGNGDVTINANGGGSTSSNGGNGSTETPTPVTTGSNVSPPSGSASGDDDGGSKRGLFGR